MRATHAEIVVALRLLRGSYPAAYVETGDDTVDAWVEGLQGFTGPVVQAAARRWGQTEPCFPTLPEFAAEASAVARSMTATEIGTGQRGSRKCVGCDGVGMVQTDSAGHGTYRPCRVCRAAQYARWQGGHFAPDHDCEACRALRKQPGPSR